MSHSIRQQLIEARRFDIHVCAKQIAALVAKRIWSFKGKVVESTYSYDGDHIELFYDKEFETLGERLEGEFFNYFPETEIEIKVKPGEINDVDGYYYHTLSEDQDGLIEISVSLRDDYHNRIRESSLEHAMYCVIVHEMQHVVQRCHANIQMAQIHKSPVDHLNDYREIDARTEEILCDVPDESDQVVFESKLRSYLKDYCNRNIKWSIDVEKIVENHMKFYSEKILGYLHQSTYV